MASQNVTAQSIVATVGEDVSLVFTITPTPPGGIAGRNYHFTVKSSDEASASDPVVFETDATIVDPTAATLSVSIPKAETIALGVGEFAWWLWRTDVGQSTRAAAGLFALEPGGVY